MAKILSNVLLMLSPEISEAIEKSFKELLEQKHLYQSIKIVLPELDLIYKKILQIPGIEGIPGQTHLNREMGEA